VANSRSSAKQEKSAPNSTAPSAATPKRRLTPQEGAELGGRIAIKTMQARLDKMKRGEPVREI
jgi:hypothetical protein